MPYPDYDGISDAYFSEIERGEREMIARLTEAQEEGELPRFPISYAWEICDTCRGEGGHSRRLGVISYEDWQEWEDEDRRFYMTGGYDVTCDACNGSGKVREVNVSLMPEVAQRWVSDYRDALYESAEMTRAERMMGA